MDLRRKVAKIYNYELFDSDHELFGGLNVFEVDPATFHIAAAFTPLAPLGPLREYLDPRIRLGSRFLVATLRYTPFMVTSFPELTEPPSYFNREVARPTR